jgi:uncharacterized membrane-anchored protein YhcB (DUF1043 family)
MQLSNDLNFIFWALGGLLIGLTLGLIIGAYINQRTSRDQRVKTEAELAELNSIRL